MRPFLLAAALAFPGVSQAQAQNSPKKSGSTAQLDQPLNHILDTPTAHTLDYGGFSVRSRFFNDGGLLTWLQFGVFQRLTLGTSLAVDRLVGNQSNIRVNRPEIQAHIRFYDGDRFLPALAIGFDGQGILYDRTAKVYLERSRGLYLVASREMFIPGLQIHPGVNIADFDGEQVAGWVAASWTVDEKITFLFEYDNIGKDNRINAGARFHITPFFWIDAGLREINKDTIFPTGATRKSERIVQLKYIGSF